MLVVGGMDFGGMYWLMTSTSAEKSKHNGNIQNPYKENLAFVIEHFYNTTQRDSEALLTQVSAIHIGRFRKRQRAILHRSR